MGWRASAGEELVILVRVLGQFSTLPNLYLLAMGRGREARDRRCFCGRLALLALINKTASRHCLHFSFLGE